MDRGKEWQIAFAKQALSDYKIYEILCRNNAESCHRLHYLQMFLEKTSKAYLWQDRNFTGGIPYFHTSHNVIAKVIPQITKDVLTNREFLNRNKMKEIRKICREIDLLAPAVDDDKKRLDNCEYPWANSVKGKISIPCEEKFEMLNKLINNSNGTLIIKVGRLYLQNLQS